MRYFIIGDENTVLGFGIAGVDGQVVQSREQAQRAFEQALKDSSIGIVIITERIADLIRHTVERYTFVEQFPLIVEIPDREGPKPDRPGIRELVTAAIGIKI